MKPLPRNLTALVVGGSAAEGTEGKGAAQFGAAVTAVGAAVGANSALTSAGSLGAMGSGAAAAGGAIAAGFGGAGYIGWTIGGLLYESSEMVQGTAQNMVERFVTQGPVGAVVQGGTDIWNSITGSGDGSNGSGGSDGGNGGGGGGGGYNVGHSGGGIGGDDEDFPRMML